MALIVLDLHRGRVQMVALKVGSYAFRDGGDDDRYRVRIVVAGQLPAAARIGPWTGWINRTRPLGRNLLAHRAVLPLPASRCGSSSDLEREASPATA
jgi:hypothetical protein